ncbi:hypothetical protein SAMN02910447_03012 [Ruminococcus sp. YE71]|nr:hypothetical protein SAMN02910446_03083 [Ruminococcus sp. YE78]SFW47927.1 hypothetical protein SAMN02910447_03012 [Ruminococcus sp. YE71]
MNRKVFTAVICFVSAMIISIPFVSACLYLVSSGLFMQEGIKDFNKARKLHKSIK